MFPMRTGLRITFVIGSFLALLLLDAGQPVAQDLPLALNWMTLGDFDKAYHLLLEIQGNTDLDPGLIEYLLGMARWNNGDPYGGEKHLRQALDTRPYSMEILLMLSLCLEEQGKRSDAHEMYHRILDMTSKQSMMAMKGAGRTQTPDSRITGTLSPLEDITIQDGPRGIEVVSIQRVDGLHVELRNLVKRDRVLAGQPLDLVLRAMNQGDQPVELFQRPRLKWEYWMDSDPTGTLMGGGSRIPNRGSDEPIVRLNPGEQHFMALPTFRDLTPGLWYFSVSMDIPFESSEISEDPLIHWVKVPPLGIEIIPKP